MAGPVYTLERLVWRRHGDRWLVVPGTDPVRTFADRGPAEATAREREWEIRRRVNPFRCGGPRLRYQTAFDAARLHDWCLDHGLEPPETTPISGTWAKWWDDQHAHFTDAQRAAVWEVLDRVRFFRVMESEPSEPMHLVSLPHYELDPITFNLFGQSRYVGGTPYMLVRSQATADEMCYALFVTREALTGAYVPARPGEIVWVIPEVDPFDDGHTTERPAYFEDPLESAERRPLALTTRDPPMPGRDVFVVLRRSWRLEEGPRGSWRWTPSAAKTCGRAVAAFGTLAAADAYMARLEAEARDYPSPFRFGSHLEWGRLDASTAYGMLSELAPLNITSLWEDYKAPDRVWNEWWDAAVDRMSAEQVETAWSLFEKLKFYEVVAVEFRE
jgi:hypothetical protein